LFPLTTIKHFVDNKSVTKTIKIKEKDLRYLQELVSSESEKFDDVAKTTKDPEIKEESRILNSLNRQLRV